MNNVPRIKSAKRDDSFVLDFPKPAVHDRVLCDNRVAPVVAASKPDVEQH